MKSCAGAEKSAVALFVMFHVLCYLTKLMNEDFEKYISSTFFFKHFIFFFVMFRNGL